MVSQSLSCNWLMLIRVVVLYDYSSRGPMLSFYSARSAGNPSNESPRQFALDSSTRDTPPICPWLRYRNESNLCAATGLCPLPDQVQRSPACAAVSRSPQAYRKLADDRIAAPPVIAPNLSISRLLNLLSDFCFFFFISILLSGLETYFIQCGCLLD